MDPIGEAPIGAERGESLERWKKNREEGLYWYWPLGRRKAWEWLARVTIPCPCRLVFIIFYQLGLASSVLKTSWVGSAWFFGWMSFSGRLNELASVHFQS
jgi:hypothetical protein